MKATKKTELCQCPKCDGAGYISAFAGIANGVCFTCNGEGKVLVRKVERKIKPLTEYQAAMIEKIKAADFSNMGYEDLAKCRNFSHWKFPQCPDLLKIWMARGESHFQVAQAARLSEVESQRTW